MLVISSTLPFTRLSTCLSPSISIDTIPLLIGLFLSSFTIAVMVMFLFKPTTPAILSIVVVFTLFTVMFSVVDDWPYTSFPRYVAVIVWIPASVRVTVKFAQPFTKSTMFSLLSIVIDTLPSTGMFALFTTLTWIVILLFRL